MMELIRNIYHTLRLGGAGLRYHLSPMLGAKTRYAIDPGYKHRPKPSYFDDTANSDNWQREVYEKARLLMRDEGLKSVYDLGCGSGYKLINILGEFETTGIDLPETIGAVQKRYPSRRWVAGRFETLELGTADLVICSDVIEHVEDPDALMRIILSATKEWIILSTPARELMYSDRQRFRFGPPDNPTHLREWSMAEIMRYAEQFFDVVSHEITNRIQGTQMIVGRKSAIRS